MSSNFYGRSKIKPFKTVPALSDVEIAKSERKVFVGKPDNGAESFKHIMFGKVIEQSPSKNVFDFSLWLDVAFPHVVLIAGRRGSGKSYDLGVIAEGLAADTGGNFSSIHEKFATVIFDLQSQFWTLDSSVPGSSANMDAGSWSLEGTIKSANLYIPSGGRSVTGTESEFVIPPNTMELADWLDLIHAEQFEPKGQLMRALIQRVKEEGSNFEVTDLIRCLKENDFESHDDFQDSTKQSLKWRLQAVVDLGFFKHGDSVADQVLKNSGLSVVMLRELDEEIKAVVVAVTMRQIERAMSSHHQKLKFLRHTNQTPPEDNFPSRAWVLIDEAHLVCPADSKTAANKVIVDYVKRGRDAGLSLVMATQQPSALDRAAISQVDISIIHKLSIDEDIKAATQRLPSQLPSEIKRQSVDISSQAALVRSLNIGECILADAESSRAIIAKCRPRVLLHGGGEPVL